jgi:hypothetical protein
VGLPEAQQLDRHGRDDGVPDRRDERNAANDAGAAVAVAVDHRVAPRRTLEGFEAPQRPREMSHQRSRIPADREHRRGEHAAPIAARVDLARAGDRERDPPALEHLREPFVVARHRTDLLDELGGHLGHEPGRVARGAPVALGHQDVEPDGGGLSIVDRGDQLREQAARPGPLPEALEARLVDVDDQDGRRRARTRHDALEAVEDEGAGLLLEGDRLEALEEHHQREHAERDGAPAAGRRCGRRLLRRRGRLGRLALLQSGPLSGHSRDIRRHRYRT